MYRSCWIIFIKLHSSNIRRTSRDGRTTCTMTPIFVSAFNRCPFSGGEGKSLSARAFVICLVRADRQSQLRTVRASAEALETKMAPMPRVDRGLPSAFRENLAVQQRTTGRFALSIYLRWSSSTPTFLCRVALRYSPVESHHNVSTVGGRDLPKSPLENASPRTIG